MKTTELSYLIEGKHTSTKVKKHLNAGSRQIRNTVESANRRLKEMLDPSNDDAPNPKSDDDMSLGTQASAMLENAASKIRLMKESKRTVKESNNSDEEQLLSSEVTKILKKYGKFDYVRELVFDTTGVSVKFNGSAYNLVIEKL